MTTVQCRMDCDHLLKTKQDEGTAGMESEVELQLMDEKCQAKCRKLESDVEDKLKVDIGKYFV